MNKRLGPIAIALAAGAAAAGLAGPTNSAENPPNCGGGLGCRIVLTAAGPLPNTLVMNPLGSVGFRDADSVAHTVVFANGLCSLAVAPGPGQPQPGGAHCGNRFMEFVGSYAYTVDGKFAGTVVTSPLARSVTLTARTHTVRSGTRLTLHGRLMRGNVGSAPPPPVAILARHSSKEPFERVATVRTRGGPQTTYGWKLAVQPRVTTTYIAKVTAQRLCYFPASRCAQPQGQVWTNAKSRPFTVRIRQQGPR